jgi:hypothetical protein
MTNIRNSVILDASLDTTSDNHATEKVHLTTTRALCDLSHYNINEIRQLRKNKRENAASAIWEKTSSKSEKTRLFVTQLNFRLP